MTLQLIAEQQWHQMEDSVLYCFSNQKNDRMMIGWNASFSTVLKRN